MVFVQYHDHGVEAKAKAKAKAGWRIKVQGHILNPLTYNLP